MSSSLATTLDLSVYSKEDHVLLLPEHTNGMIPQVCYAKVTKVGLGQMTLATKKLPSLPATSVSVNTRIHQPAVVTATEVNGNRVGLWLRKGVMTITTDERLHGQVIEYVNRPGDVAIRTYGRRP